ncbi:MAG: acetolactate synthase isozyme1 large subunit [Marinovum sp.]|nr:acetolactate synthase isozyme1 large subunit [Marinovum sp.]
MKRPLGAQISHYLKSQGVEVIFGIPGVHNQEMYRGIEEAGIRHVLARHEQGAGFMADGYARATGKPGVAYVITGPGLCNIMTPMGQAYSDSVSMLVLSSCLDETSARRGQLHQMLDQAAAARTVCDWSEPAHSAAAAYTLIDRAFEEFAHQRARPKHIQVPIAQLEAMSDPGPARQVPAQPVTGGEAALSAVVELIQKANKPLFIFGGGAVSAKVMPLLEKTGAAAISTFAGRGVVASDYPLYLGACLARPSSADLIATADLVVVIGSELAEVDLWRAQLGHKDSLVRVDIDPQVLADPQSSDIRILMRSEDFVGQLTAQLEPSDKRTGWQPDDVKQARQKWTAETDAEFPGILPVCRALQEVMPEQAMIYSDMTQFAYLAKEVWDMPRAAHWHHPFGFGTLGYALPAAIGGAVARKDLPTVAIAGDYGFQYTLPELGVAVELGLSLPILVWDNTKLKAIEDSMVAAQIAPNAVQALNPDFSAVARAYGAAACRPQTLRELQSALIKAFAEPCPTVIHMTPELR